MLALTQIPYQRSWAEQLQQDQLKREVAGTSRIEGAEFTERELDAAIASGSFPARCGTIPHGKQVLSFGPGTFSIAL
ncbi:MAG: hypothetical protein GEU92_21360, partial [Alphaproteobacteria bacterium]|nr:hypothetical protein [Alphaproteobacteria bacterium]